MSSENSLKVALKKWVKNNGKSIAIFAGGFLLGVFTIQQEILGIRLGGVEYVLIKKSSIPKSLSIEGKWFYETEISDVELEYDDVNCVSIMGEVDIAQDEATNEFNIVNAKRRLCIDSTSKEIRRNVIWSSKIAAILPESRQIIISLSTTDPSPRIGYIQGTIQRTDDGDYPSKFEGSMYYLNTKNQQYSNTTITFCKEGTDCARNINSKFK